MNRRCEAHNARGLPCSAAPLVDARFCFAHDPEHADEAAAARRSGGLRRRREGTIKLAFELEPLDSVAGIRRLVDAIVTDALALDAGVPRLRTLIAASNLATKLLELGELEDRVARLEGRTRVRPHDSRVAVKGSLLDDEDVGEAG